MKKLIGLGVLMVTGMTAFAAPAAAYERFDGRNRREAVAPAAAYERFDGRNRREAVVVRRETRAPIHREVRADNARVRR